MDTRAQEWTDLVGCRCKRCGAKTSLETGAVIGRSTLVCAQCRRELEALAPLAAA